MVKIFPDQKEYLKKYLSGNKQKNLKKKSLNTSKSVKLIDDDETIKSANLDDDEIFLDGEEAPQIVLGDGIDSSSLQDGLKRWKSISAIQMKVQEKSKFLNNFSTVSSPSTSKIGDEERNVNLNSRQLNENNSVSKPKKYINDKQDHSLKHDSACSDNLSSRILYEDASPTTRQRKSISNHYSPERNNFKKNDRNKDLSSPKRRNRSPSNDLSPQRTKTTERNKIKYSSLKCVEKTLTTGLSPQTRRTSTNDISPQRKRSSRWDAVNKTRESQDFSPVMPKKSSSSSDKSPQRKNDFEKKNSKQELPKKRSSCDNKSSLYKKNRSDQGKIDSEERTRKDLKGSTKKRNHSRDLLVRSSSSDLSPQRKKNEKGHNDRESFPIKRRTTYSSPSRNYKSNSRSTSRTKQGYTKNQKENLSTKQNNNPHLSPPRFEKTYRKGISNEDRVIKMADGKLSGLRNAKDLQEDIKYIREKEYELLKETSIQAGQYAEPVIRSHARYNLESLENELKNKKKEEENEKKQEVYNRWGKGLKQIEDHKTKLVEQKYESTKPLARYADDKDLDKMLKQVEREGDPMLEYLRSKKEKDRIHKKHAEIPIYKGSYPENRYSIRPGYRWDGVDRSNGYEKKYFEKQNAKRALEEEAYRYSTEDM